MIWGQVLKLGFEKSFQSEKQMNYTSKLVLYSHRHLCIHACGHVMKTSLENWDKTHRWAQNIFNNIARKSGLVVMDVAWV